MGKVFLISDLPSIAVNRCQSLLILHADGYLYYIPKFPFPVRTVKIKLILLNLSYGQLKVMVKLVIWDDFVILRFKIV